jgi:hypothetical protein
MNGSNSVKMSTATAIAVPATFALPALETILKEFTQHPGTASPALDIRQLHVPFEALITVPVEAHVTSGCGRNEWCLTIRAAHRPNLYPQFEGTLTLLSAARSGSQLQMDGRYSVPFGAVGRVVDLTVLRCAAEESLRRFLRDVANKVATLSRWVSFG